MAMILVRIGLVVGTVALAEYSPVTAFLTLWVLAVWLLPRAFHDYRETRRLRALVEPAEERIRELETDLALIREVNINLVDEVHQLQEQANSANASRSNRTAAHPLYRKVGLDQDCPRWVAEAVRREYRKRLHPDGRPPSEKAEAERQFKEMEGVFGEIWKVREF